LARTYLSYPRTLAGSDDGSYVPTTVGPYRAVIDTVRVTLGSRRRSVVFYNRTRSGVATRRLRMAVIVMVLRFDEGTYLYAYVGNNAATIIDPLGPQHTPGGPWHPDPRIVYCCLGTDDCATLSWKTA
jgi:hypothetical protein